MVRKGQVSLSENFFNSHEVHKLSMQKSLRKSEVKETIGRSKYCCGRI